MAPNGTRWGFVENKWEGSKKKKKKKKRVKREWLHCKSVNPMYKANNWQRTQAVKFARRFPRSINFRFFFFFFLNIRMQGDQIIFSVRGSSQSLRGEPGEPSLFARRFCKSSVPRHSRKFSHAAITSHEPIHFWRLNQIGRPKLIWVGAPKLAFDWAHVKYDARA